MVIRGHPSIDGDCDHFFTLQPSNTCLRIRDWQAQRNPFPARCGGVSGMSAALETSAAGYPVHLVESS